MANAGQVVTGIIGGVIGFIVAGPAGALYGAGIGLSIGAALYPPDIEIETPTPMDLQLQSSQYGKTIPVLYGTRKIAGNLIWYGNFQTIENTEEVGGKGGDPVTYTNYTYSVSLAIGLCMGPATVVRAWAGKKLIPSLAYRIYEGDQVAADSHIASFVSRAPVWKNLCYVVLENYPLGASPYIPNFTFEVTTALTVPVGAPITAYIGFSDHIFAMALDDDYLYVLTYYDNKVVKFNRSDGSIVLTFITEQSSYATGAYSVDGEDIAVDDNYVYIGLTTLSQVCSLPNAFPPKMNSAVIEKYDKNTGVFVSAFSTFEDQTFGCPYQFSNQFLYTAGSVQEHIWLNPFEGNNATQGGIAISEGIVYFTAKYTKRTQLTTGAEDWGPLEVKYRIYKNLIPLNVEQTPLGRIAIDNNNDLLFITTYNEGDINSGRVGIYSKTSGLFKNEIAVGKEVMDVDIDDFNFVYITSGFWDKFQILTKQGRIIQEVGTKVKSVAADRLGYARVEFTTGYLSDTAYISPSTGIGEDAFPSDVSKSILTNDLYGLGLDESYLDLTVFDETRTHNETNDLKVSMKFNRQISVLDALQYILQHHDGFITYMDGLIAHRQLKSETSTGALSSANNDFVQQKKQFPIQMSKQGSRDYNNKIRVEYTKRKNDYAIGTAIADDIVDIDKYGTKDVAVKLDGLTTFTRAAKMANLLLRKSLSSPENLSFKLGVKNLTIKPGEVWDITDGNLELIALPARISAIREGKDYIIEVESIEEKDIYDYITYGDDTSDPPDLPVLTDDPGNVVRPLIIELPALYSGDINKIAVSYSRSAEESWAGASLYQAYSAGGSYTKIESKAWSGITGDVIALGNDGLAQGISYSHYIDIELDSDAGLSSATDFDDLITTAGKNLIIISTSSGNKFIRFQDADLIGTRQWRLSGLIYDTVGFPELNTYGDVTIDDDVAFHENAPFIINILDADRGKTLFFKVPSFNFAGEEQSLADVDYISEYIDALDDKPLEIANMQINSIGVDGDDEITIPAGDIALEWITRNRYNTGGYNYERTDTIIDDSDFQDFVIEIYNGANLLRTITQTAKSYTYTTAQQTTDGGPYNQYDFKIKVNTISLTSDIKIITVNTV